MFITGMMINVWADSVLLSLRRGDEGYKIPRGGLYEYVSSPNYFGEIVEWLGWAVMTWSLAGLSFFLYTAANLGPRAQLTMIGITNNFLSVTPNLEKLLFHLFTSIGTSSFWISFSVYNDSVFGKFTRFGLGLVLRMWVVNRHC